MNAHDERFNRTIQEEFVDYHEDALLDPGYFNDKLLDYLLWYNGKRPHWGIDLLTPIQVLWKFNHECNMSWPNTSI
jgi:transposase InsO family protein